MQDFVHKISLVISDIPFFKGAFFSSIILEIFVNWVKSSGKDILIICKGPIKTSAGTTYIAEAIYPSNFRQSRKRFALRLHYNKSNSFLFPNTAKRHPSKAMDS